MRSTILALLALPLGCKAVPLTHVESFGTASETLAESSATAFSLLNAAGSEQAAQKLVSFPPENPAEASELWGALEASLDQGLIPPAGLTERQALLCELAAYGAALGAIASADHEAELEEASADLFESLIVLNESMSELSGQESMLGESDILGAQQAIVTAGGALLAPKRRKAIRTLVVATDPVVQKAAALLAEDLKADGPLARATHEVLDNRLRLVQFYYNQNGANLSFEERASLVDRVRLLHMELGDVDDLYTNASAAAVALGAAHTALVAAAEEKTLTSDEFVAALGKLTSHVSKLKAIGERLSLAAAK